MSLMAPLALDPLLAGIGHGSDSYWTGAKRSSCGGEGCDIEKYAQVVASNFPDPRNVQDAIDSTVERSGQSSPMTATEGFPRAFLPGIRFGTYTATSNTAGLVLSTPGSADHTATGEYEGSWLLPNRRYCNPLEWLSSSKLAITHSGANRDKRSGVIFTKLVVCLKANCAANDAACAARKCYASKKGKCVKFNKDVFEDYADRHERKHSEDAYDLFAVGNYTTDCEKAAEISSFSVIAGN